jgi:hypothetical protein
MKYQLRSIHRVSKPQADTNPTTVPNCTDSMKSGSNNILRMRDVRRKKQHVEVNKYNFKTDTVERCLDNSPPKESQLRWKHP